MGLQQTIICPVCNYKTFTSGGVDRGRIIWTNTFVCLDSKILNDLVIDKEGDMAENEGSNTEIKEGQRCEKCGGQNFELWNSEQKPCPKCGTEMTIDPKGAMSCWD
ncbi:MAG TPA: hypothetical protein PLV21_08275 [Cyclobacteriaceae bacterium]|nr:hypothetical protein [Cyclobacteriaceae bacterium]HRJ81864.1 hypothetical protein [Cyclobacteriaceae bacterium]